MAGGARGVVTSRWGASRGQHAMRLKYINDRTAAIALCSGTHAHRTRRRTCILPSHPSTGIPRECGSAFGPPIITQA